MIIKIDSHGRSAGHPSDRHGGALTDFACLIAYSALKERFRFGENAVKSL